MPKRLPPTLHARVYEKLVLLHGASCQSCGASEPPLGRLDIDHRDNDRTNYDPENLQLLCRTCNVKKQRNKEIARRFPELEAWTRNSPSVCATEQVRRDIGDSEDGGPIWRANCRMEPSFRQFILEMLNDRAAIQQRKAIFAGAEHSGCSPETARRYLGKMTSDRGPCMIAKDQFGRSLIMMRTAENLEQEIEDYE